MKAIDKIHLPEARIKINTRSRFLKSLMTSLLSTLTDFVVSLLLVGLGMYYITSTTLGGLSGALVSFSLSRLWVFQKKDGKLTMQLSKFIFTNFFSIMLNTSGVFFLIERFDISFLNARILVASFIGIFFNYFLYRYFVFRK